MQVMSVTGPVDEAADLGRVLVHEHITIDMPGQELDPSYKRRTFPEIVARGCRTIAEAARSLGVGAIVDPCPIELGRDPELYADGIRKVGREDHLRDRLLHGGDGHPALLAGPRCGRDRRILPFGDHRRRRLDGPAARHHQGRHRTRCQPARTQGPGGCSQWLRREAVSPSSLIPRTLAMATFSRRCSPRMALTLRAS
jgi:hypothetical protein